MIKDFQDEKLNQTLSLFLKDMQLILNGQLISVYIYGSALYNDLCPGYGDLDFLVILRNDLASCEVEKLIKQRIFYRTEYPDLYNYMLEGAFLPLRLIQGETGRALWWGTKGEKVWEENQLDKFTMYTIKNHGLLLFGESQYHMLPVISKEEINQFLIDFVSCMREHGKGGSIHSIDWLLLTSKFMCWLSSGEILSKSQAADWGLKHLKNSWKEHLLKSKELRKDTSKVRMPEYSEWLNKLDSVIIEASNDLDEQLRESRNFL